MHLVGIVQAGHALDFAVRNEAAFVPNVPAVEDSKQRRAHYRVQQQRRLQKLTDIYTRTHKSNSKNNNQDGGETGVANFRHRRITRGKTKQRCLCASLIIYKHPRRRRRIAKTQVSYHQHHHKGRVKYFSKKARKGVRGKKQKGTKQITRGEKKRKKIYIAVRQINTLGVHISSAEYGLLYYRGHLHWNRTRAGKIKTRKTDALHRGIGRVLAKTAAQTCLSEELQRSHRSQTPPASTPTPASIPDMENCRCALRSSALASPAGGGIVSSRKNELRFVPSAATEATGPPADSDDPFPNNGRPCCSGSLLLQARFCLPLGLQPQTAMLRWLRRSAARHAVRRPTTPSTLRVSYSVGKRMAGAGGRAGREVREERKQGW